MLLDRDLSCVVLVDVQEKLAPLLPGNASLIARGAWILRLAETLSVPVMVCEQYPRGLGHTVEALRPFRECSPSFEKVAFSCFADAPFAAHLLDEGRKQVVLIGIETHVCVLQSALQMKAAGFEVFVVRDAVGSRHALDHETGLSRMQAEGVHVVTSEMVFFEWLRVAGTNEFRELSRQFMREEA